jgi:ribosomal protein RSM22 (predicted rRNA methylase)
MSRAPPVDPEKIVELDYMSMCGLKTNELPDDIQAKLLKLLEQFGYKGDLERFGKYMVARYRSRACSETPKVLPSVLLPEKSMKRTKTPLERLLNSKGFDDLRGAMPDLFKQSQDSGIGSSFSQTAISNAEDDKHKTYQMFYSPGTAVTYLAHRFPATYASNFRVLMEVFKRVPDFNPTRILDYGSGPGVSTLAALKIWQADETRKVVCVEPSLNMQQVGNYLLSDSQADLSWHIGLYGVSGQFDLITVSYVLMEIRDQDSRDLLINSLYSKLRPGGVLVILDCGTPTGFRYIHRIREQLIIKQKEIKSDKNWHIIAPCSHENACPLALTGKDWCHFDQRVRRLPHSVYSKGSRKNNADYEKFSYLVIRKSPGPREIYGSELEAPTSWEKSFFWPRIVMPAIKAGGHTLLDVCSTPNNFERLVVSKSKPHAFGYRFSRKIMWGDLWRYPKRLARKEARESYTPDEVKQHLEMLHEDAKKATKDISKFPDGKKLEEASYGQ